VDGPGARHRNRRLDVKNAIARMQMLATGALMSTLSNTIDRPDALSAREVCSHLAA